MNLLHIDSSITGGASVSRQISTRIVDEIRQHTQGVVVTRRDLDAAPLDHLDSRMLAAMAPGSESDVETRRKVADGFAALEEFLRADVVVIGAPMYNFAISSHLKAWIDRIVIVGKTFRYTEKGPEGLSGGKKVIIASSRGGRYVPGTPHAAFDFQETYLRAVFQFLGIDDIHFVRAEGIAIGPEQREAALNAALESVARVPSPFATSKAA
jgi:FMN-dependent NADH-azoreductase